jgi:hypothetical protein
MKKTLSVCFVVITIAACRSSGQDADNDHMEDSWEDRYSPATVNSNFFDALLDPDGDGWSNRAECRYSGAYRAVRPDAADSIDPDGNMRAEYPVPEIRMTFFYAGVQSADQPITVHVFGDAQMTGLPDAVFTVAAHGGSATTATETLGRVSDRVMTGTLAGRVVPKSLRITLDDSFTSAAHTSGFDVDGVIYHGEISSGYYAVGSIDYRTGKYEIDLSVFKGRKIIISTGDFGFSDVRSDYVECDLADVTLGYLSAGHRAFPREAILKTADSGHVREGTNYFFAFLDLDGNNQWSAGEPCGVAEGFAVDVGWDRQRVNIELTDYRLGYLRMSLANGLRSDDVYLRGAAGGGTGSGQDGGQHPRIIVNRLMVDSMASFSNVLDKTMVNARDYLHEGDFMADNKLALDWGLLGVANPHQRTSAVYEVRRGDPPGELITVFTNKFAYLRAKAIATYPVDAHVYSARPEFRWTMPEGYPAFAIELKKNTTSGTTVYSAFPVQVPVRNTDGEYVWRAPIYAGSRTPNGETIATNTVYYWRGLALNAKFVNSTLAPNWSD